MTVWSVLQGILMSVWVWCVVRVMNLGRSCGFCSLVSGNRFEGRCIFHHPSPLYLSAAGPVPSPFDCFLANRGLKTLHIRMREHQRNAMAVAQFLSSSPYVAEVMYPGRWAEGALSSGHEHLGTMEDSITSRALELKCWNGNYRTWKNNCELQCYILNSTPFSICYPSLSCLCRSPLPPSA